MDEEDIRSFGDMFRKVFEETIKEVDTNSSVKIQTAENIVVELCSSRIPVAQLREMAHESLNRLKNNNQKKEVFHYD